VLHRKPTLRGGAIEADTEITSGFDSFERLVNFGVRLNR
jgi:hypothetical protein